MSSTSTTLTMGDRGRVVIPQAIREAQGLHPGDRLIIFQDEHGMTLMTIDQLEAKVHANFKQSDVSAVASLIADRRAEAQRDLEECQRDLDKYQQSQANRQSDLVAA